MRAPSLPIFVEIARFPSANRRAARIGARVYAGRVQMSPNRRLPLILFAALLCVPAFGQMDAPPSLTPAQVASVTRLLNEARAGAASLNPAAAMILLSSMAAAEQRQFPDQSLADYRSAFALAQQLPGDAPALATQIGDVEAEAVRAVVEADGLDAGVEMVDAVTGNPAPTVNVLFHHRPSAGLVAQLEARCNPPGTQPGQFHFDCADLAISVLPPGDPLRKSILDAALTAARAETDPKQMLQVAFFLNHRAELPDAWPELPGAVVDSVARTLLYRLRAMQPSSPPWRDWVVPARWQLFSAMGGQGPDLEPILKREFPEVVSTDHFPGPPSADLAPLPEPTDAEQSALQAYRSLGSDQAHYGDDDGQAPSDTMQRSFAILDGVAWRRTYPDVAFIAYGIVRHGTPAERDHLLGSATDFLHRAAADFSTGLAAANPAQQAAMVTALLNDTTGEDRYADEVNALDRVAHLDLDGAAHRLEADPSAARPIFLAALAFGLLIARYSD